MAIHDGERTLLERDTECAHIRTAVETAVSGQGGLILFQGPAGIGKSRLLVEAQGIAVAAGTVVASAKASELEQDFAYGVVRQLFEPLLATAAPTMRESLWAAPADQAKDILVNGPGHTPVGDFALLHGLYWLTVNASQHAPLVILLDDVQWADVPSLRYLAYLLPRLADMNVLVVAALRTGEPAADASLLDQILASPATRVVRLSPLSSQATGILLREILRSPTDGEFSHACYEASGGNPLLLRELARTVTSEKLAPARENAAEVAGLGSPTVSRMVEVRMSRLPPEAAALALSVAILGGPVEMSHAAALADLSGGAAARSAEALEQLEVLRVDERHTEIVSFVHPLMQRAVYESAGVARRAVLHQRAADILLGSGADIERVAAHLLRVPPHRGDETAAVLRRAADQALFHGSPQTALTYLERALLEPTQLPAERTELVRQAGLVAQQHDWRKAADYLMEAYERTSGVEERARLAEPLGRALFMGGRNREAVPLYERAIAGLDDSLQDLRQRLQAGLINVALADTELHTTGDMLAAQLWEEPTTNGIGGRSLDSLLGWHAALAVSAEPTAVLARIHRAVAEDVLLEQANGTEAFADAWWVLITADDEQALFLLDKALAESHRRGTVAATAGAYCLRSLAWLRRGSLEEAESDGTLAMQLCDTAQLRMARPLTASFLADTLIERGRLDEARRVLEWCDRSATSATAAQSFWPDTSRGKLLVAEGEVETGLELLLDCGRRLEGQGWHNPGFLSWRTEAAMALRALDRMDEARAHAAEDLRRARQWKAPWALGRALRVGGILAKERGDMALMGESVRVLEPSPARLEFAKSLLEHGAALRRSGRRQAARAQLEQAVEVALRCGAPAVAERARGELAIAGGKARGNDARGSASLTPAERRVAELVVTGVTNRQVAQKLFITPKTVEVHLSMVYRKLGITTRAQLGKALDAEGGPTAG
ncbi:AAA family ATPase [Streptomyces sp. NPDC015492]|uniref:helix-turn-helix transcriptional regulator n=1 Tax=Streptomyces sp. NPDC015492 TaxID=3364958 RepID=UPI0036F62ADC